MALEHEKWKSIPQEMVVDSPSGCFECNICLDSANDPVVALCGHLYCWPCIYKWFYIPSASLPSDEFPQCPVCKAEISPTTLIPLYGRGQSTSIPDPETATPPRPHACGTRALLNAASQPDHLIRPYRRNPYQGHPRYVSDDTVSSSPSPLFNRTSDGVNNVFQPVVGMFGEMVYARVFGNSQSLYTYPNSYQHVGNSNPRLRRQEMQLTRISLFLFCCFLLCLFLF